MAAVCQYYLITLQHTAVQITSTLKNSAFATECIYVCYMICAVSSNYSTEQHQLVSFCNGGALRTDF
jgi:hypothetical protein